MSKSDSIFPVVPSHMKVTDRACIIALAATLLFSKPVAAADSWNENYPWWCNVNNETCMKYSSETTYVGPTYTDCYAILETGWTQQAAVDVGCASS